MLLSPCPISIIINSLVAIVARHPFGPRGGLCLLRSLEGSHVLLSVLGSLGPVAPITEHIRTTALLEPLSLEFVARYGHPWV